MNEWFHYSHILREKRLAYAVSQLVGDARQWWLQEVDYRWYYKEPSITSWRDLKKLLRNKYAPQANAKKPALFKDHKKIPTPVEAKPQPALVENLIKPHKNKKMEDKPTSPPKKVTKQVVIHKQILKTSFESSGVGDIADNSDLRSNPFQVGEDDEIMASSLEPHKDEELLEAENTRPRTTGHEEQLVPEEALIVPAGPLTRSRAK
ncbi:uncharacterized protein LOC111831176, partial [Capsella rubella]|uniref:uncharacterized protein LOC111831176 n=1 Tax=Capsella rubella TaxID=81985 RepID=UPI000CD5BE72